MWGPVPAPPRELVVEILGGSDVPLTGRVVAHRAGLANARTLAILNELRDRRIVQRSTSGGQRVRRGCREHRWRLALEGSCTRIK